MANTVEFCSVCTSSACGVISKHSSHKKHSMARSLYQFQVYYHVRKILKRLQVPLPHEAGFNAADNPYTSEEFLKKSEDCGVPHDSMRYREEKFYWTYSECELASDYISPDSMLDWIIEKYPGFTKVGLYRISESVRNYAYLILNLQASARSSIIANTASASTAQRAFLNNFKNVVICRVDIEEDIKCYQTLLVTHLAKLIIAWEKTLVNYNNKIFISDSKFVLRKNDKINTLKVGKK